jgi:hypothetical protein
MMKEKIRFFLLALAVFSTSCTEEYSLAEIRSDSYPDIYPDYTDVTVPANIAPLHFAVRPSRKAVALFRGKDCTFEVSSDKGDFRIPEKKWRRLLSGSRGEDIEITVTTVDSERVKTVYRPFVFHVAEEPVDPYVAYRLIEPGYALWNRMGIYQRHLETYRESAIYENRMTNYNCVNCHSFCMQNPDRMLFHMRSSHAGTVLSLDGGMEFLQTKTDGTISALVYPSWHPSGRYVAFSVNRTTQNFHPTQRVEVYDTASDAVVYDIENRTIISTPAIFSPADFETFPSFSSDGRTLYFCTAKACAMPDSIHQLRYSLCSVAFDPRTGAFGSEVDTLYNAGVEAKSVSFPRVSPDGKFLLCTLSSYGTFPIWHRDADLYMIDLEKRTGYYPEAANSADTDSYHSWSSNSRWVVFSSRRMDGLYTRPFITYISKEGQASKPFVLPQKDITHYTELMRSYNIPEFITGKVENRSYMVMKKAKQKDSARPIEFRLQDAGI